MMDFQGKFSLPENLKILTKCPFCSANMEKLDVRLLQDMDDRQMVHIHCAACLGSMIALFLLAGPGIASIGLVTDLSFDDVVKFNKNDKIGLDDVLKTHEFLKSPRFLRRIVD
ncbi:hypothetical protein KKD84_01750 [Patescibacteria group bacterium]|nr:hypothetical protein [Patescibacteria group bacterium]